ncbi:hypothetical protein TRFO_36769 [Tritrichomonas foetus]|uniref:Uncharacterized protein n=1 Tax=Tritrichomonas foetus TaxID=1144522 RepID=A0A1J4JHS9_9EUKA|nr:hypothetical protein TRFO_36769 [Tritrichomonas foetus]|eukprot:OHS97053.1 hypothetical protein TRFO_36769 [Tritrichomonas foetus]
MIIIFFFDDFGAWRKYSKFFEFIFLMSISFPQVILKNGSDRDNIFHSLIEGCLLNFEKDDDISAYLFQCFNVMTSEFKENQINNQTEINNQKQIPLQRQSIQEISVAEIVKRNLFCCFIKQFVKNHLNRLEITALEIAQKCISEFHFAFIFVYLSNVYSNSPIFRNFMTTIEHQIWKLLLDDEPIIIDKNEFIVSKEMAEIVFECFCCPYFRPIKNNLLCYLFWKSRKIKNSKRLISQFPLISTDFSVITKELFSEFHHRILLYSMKNQPFSCDPLNNIINMYREYDIIPQVSDIVKIVKRSDGFYSKTLLTDYLREKNIFVEHNDHYYYSFQYNYYYSVIQLLDEVQNTTSKCESHAKDRNQNNRNINDYKKKSSNRIALNSLNILLTERNIQKNPPTINLNQLNINKFMTFDFWEKISHFQKNGIIAKSNPYLFHGVACLMVSGKNRFKNYYEINQFKYPKKLNANLMMALSNIKDTKKLDPKKLIKNTLIHIKNQNLISLLAICLVKRNEFDLNLFEKSVSPTIFVAFSILLKLDVPIKLIFQKIKQINFLDSYIINILLKWWKNLKLTERRKLLTLMPHNFIYLLSAKDTSQILSCSNPNYSIFGLFKKTMISESCSINYEQIVLYLRNNFEKKNVKDFLTSLTKKSTFLLYSLYEHIKDFVNITISKHNTFCILKKILSSKYRTLSESLLAFFSLNILKPNIVNNTTYQQIILHLPLYQADINPEEYNFYLSIKEYISNNIMEIINCFKEVHDHIKIQKEHFWFLNELDYFNKDFVFSKLEISADSSCDRDICIDREELLDSSLRNITSFYSKQENLKKKNLHSISW